MTAPMTPYSTASSLFGNKPTWIPDELDQMRILSYQTYEQIYWNVPDTFKLTQRGTDDRPIYIPSARTIIDTTNRYTAPGFAVSLEPRIGTNSSDAQVAARLVFDDLFRREKFKTKFNGSKRYGLIRGDWFWHITADPSKPNGRRLSINDIDPASVFPITDPDDVDKITGVHIIDQFRSGSETYIKRLTYRKVPKPDGTNTITSEEGLFKPDKWQGPSDRPMKITKPLMNLPPEITALPVYHIKNFHEPQNPFGSSEIRGFERIMAALNQSMSDEELALALEGLGMYATDAPPPTDDDGNEMPWIFGPGMVVETPAGTNFSRVSGVGNVGPMQDHMNSLWNWLKQASSTPDIAIGTVDVSVAQSGIALALQLGPMLAKSGEKNDEILDTHDQMFYDILNGWYPAYEQTSFADTNVRSTVGDAIPIDRAARFTELNDMLDHKVIDTEYYRAEARKLGYDFPEDMGTRVATETAALSTASDPFSSRATGELDADESSVEVMT